MVHILHVLLVKHLALHYDILDDRLQQYFVPKVLLNKAGLRVLQLK